MEEENEVGGAIRAPVLGKRNTVRNTGIIPTRLVSERLGKQRS